MILPPLTREQLLGATTHTPLCYVKAGPGSGKTFLATEAYGYLRYERYRRDVRGVVGVTFARSARSELESRIRSRWGARSIGWPNGVITFDELHRKLVRYLVYHDHLSWPSTEFPRKVDDTWQDHPGATGSPGKKVRYAAGLGPEGTVVVSPAVGERRAPRPCFIDADSLSSALKSGHVTHAEIRNILSDGLVRRGQSGAAWRDVARRCLRESLCHIIVDESFDMNELDAEVVQLAIAAGVTVTLVGDPWQSLYEFRGASPKRVEALVERNGFLPIDMPGSHRYLTSEMQALARTLFDERPFSVRRAVQGDSFDVVLAHDWTTLWDESRIAVLPVGRPSRLDGSHLANCFVVLLNEVVQETFGREASGIGEARRKLGIEPDRRGLDEALGLLREVAVPIDEVWAALERSFRKPEDRWKVQGALAHKYMNKLRALAYQGKRPCIGLTIHQSKGLEWDRVLLLNNELTAREGYLNRLVRRHESHRRVYVALTRARRRVRILRVPVKAYAPSLEPIQSLVGSSGYNES